MPGKIAFIIDPPHTLQKHHDTSLAMIMACHRLKITVAVIEANHVFVQQAQVMAQVTWLAPKDSYEEWYTTTHQETIALASFDAVMMRKDPPCDLAYIHLTHMLSLAKQNGAYIVNDPDALRLFHEKWLIERFPHCIAPTFVSSDKLQLTAFIREHHKVVLKPLDGMGGRGVFVVTEGDPNTNSLLESMLSAESGLVMAQKHLPAITQGDKRILVLHGQAFPFLLARIPQGQDFRGNLAAGGRGVAKPLSERDIWLIAQIQPFLVEHGLDFVGVDVIGDFITEINITSPTCVREIDEACGSDIAGLFIEGVMRNSQARKSLNASF